MFQFFIELSRIKKCFTQKGGVFVLEEFGKITVALIVFWFFQFFFGLWFLQPVMYFVNEAKA